MYISIVNQPAKFRRCPFHSVQAVLSGFSSKKATFQYFRLFVSIHFKKVMMQVVC